MQIGTTIRTFSRNQCGKLTLTNTINTLVSEVTQQNVEVSCYLQNVEMSASICL